MIYFRRVPASRLTHSAALILSTSVMVSYWLLSIVPVVAQDAAPAAVTPTATQSPVAANQASIADLQAKLDSLNADATIESTQKERLASAYRAAIDSYRAIATDTERIAMMAKSASQAGDNLLAARELVKQGPGTPEFPNNADQMPIEDLRQRRSEAEAELAAVRQALQTVESNQREREAKRAQLPKLITDSRTALETAQAAVVPELEDDPQGSLRAAREVERAAKIASIKKNIESLVQEQSTIDAEAELLPTQIEVAKARVTVAEQTLRFWSDQLGAQKQYRVETDLAEHREHLQASGIDLEKSMVVEYAAQWTEMLREQSRLERKRTREESRYAELSEVFKSTQTEIDKDIANGRGLRSGLGLKLQMTRNRLPTNAGLAEEMRGIDELLDRSRILQTELELTLEELRADYGTAMSIEPRIELPMIQGAVDPNEVVLLKEMKADVDQHLNTLVEVKSTLELKRKVVSDIRSLIETHVIWIRNASPFRASDLTMAWWTFRWIVHPTHLKAIGQSLVKGLTSRLDLIVSWAVLGLGIWCLGSRIRRRLTRTGEKVRDAKLNVSKTSSMRPTLVALMLTGVLVIPPVATLAIVGYAILEGAARDRFLVSVGDAFLIAAAALFPMESLRQLLRPGGLAIAHFGYRSEIVIPPRTSLRLLIDLGIPILLVWAIANASGRSQMDASLGRLLFAVGMTALACLIWFSLHPKSGLLSDYLRERKDSWTARLRRVWHPLVSLVPLGLVGLSLAGYSYTSILLTGRLYWTLWLAIGVIVLGGLLRQWFFTYRQRVAAAKTTGRLVDPRVPDSPAVELISGEGAAIEIPVEPPLDVDEMNAQSLSLIQSIMWLAVIVGIAVIWSPVLPAVRFLDAVTLWDTTAADGTKLPVTLANLIFAIPIVFLTYVAVRNIPGLLEVVLLERLPLDRPAKYAITTLASYALAIIGIIYSAQTLGLRWDGIQWLIAALGVGLGFGLQEIFANFVSGLILLFEQPIRVGDVVTIDGVTGTVSRIRMRATGVTNWERQELIIPNKDLITGRLINWTLTDSTNRITLNIGIAYGSDTRKACKLLEQICAQHDNLLFDPKPVVTFESFGDSTLNLVVRCYLGSIELRLPTLHELNTTINERFNQEKIEIAFPQRDLHIRTLPPQLTSLFQSGGGLTPTVHP